VDKGRRHGACESVAVSRAVEAYRRSMRAAALLGFGWVVVVSTEVVPSATVDAARPTRKVLAAAAFHDRVAGSDLRAYCRGDCGLVADADLRAYCRGDCGLVQRADARALCRGDCGLVTDGDLRALCRGDCGLVGDGDLRAVCRGECGLVSDSALRAFCRGDCGLVPTAPAGTVPEE